MDQNFLSGIAPSFLLNLSSVICSMIVNKDDGVKLQEGVIVYACKQ